MADGFSLNKPSLPDMRLTVKVEAHFDWPHPPNDKAEEIMRQEANNLARAAASRTEDAVRLLIMQILTWRP